MQITYLTILIILKKGNQQQNALRFFSFQTKVYPGYKRFSSRVQRYTSVSWVEAKPLAASGSLYTLGAEIGNRASLRNRRLEVVGARKNGRARGKHARGNRALPSRVSLSCARSFLRPLYHFQAPATQAKTAHEKSLVPLVTKV